MVGEFKGRDDDPANPLSRALNRLLEDGHPFSRLSQCFCIDPYKNLPLGWYFYSFSWQQSPVFPWI